MENLKHIILSSAKGDEKAQRMLYLRFRTKWYMMAMRYGKNKPQADDIFQEGLIQIFKSLENFDEGKASFQTWSSQIMIHAALNFLKKHSWVDRFEEMSQIEEHLAEEEVSYQKIAEEELTIMIQQLPLGYRLVFNMYVLEGLGHKEIADHIGISVGTSKSQLSKARKYLREHLEKHLTKNTYGQPR